MLLASILFLIFVISDKFLIILSSFISFNDDTPTLDLSQENSALHNEDFGKTKATFNTFT